MDPSRIGVCSWSLQPENPDSLVEKVRQTGLRAVQIALSPVVGQPDIWDGMIDTVRDAGIDILSGMMAMEGENYSTLETIAETGGVRSDATWKANRLQADAVAELAARHDIDLVTFHAGFIPHEADDPVRATMLERLREIADIFDRNDVAIAFETGQESAATLLAALEELQRPTVGINFDPANMILYGMGYPVTALRELSGRVMQVHIKDALPTDEAGTWGSEVVTGLGAVDWSAFFAIAKSIEPAVDFIIEREAGTHRVEDVKTAGALVSRHLGM